MTEYLATALLGTFALGLATWHVTRVVSHGSLFKPFRKWLGKKATWGGPAVGRIPPPLPWAIIWETIGCRLCFETQVAIILTWGALVTGLIVNPDGVPYAAWGFAFATGPLLTAAWAEIIRRVECVEAPE